MTRKRGRPPIPFDFSRYWSERICRERAEALKVYQRESVLLRKRRPKGLLVDRKYPTSTGVGPLVIPTGALSLTVDVLIERAQSEGRRINIKTATVEALRLRLRPYQREKLAEYLLPTALRLIRAYRRARRIKK